MPKVTHTAPSNKRRAAGQRITAWSFSRFHTYRTCPQKARFKFIDKLKEPEGPALARGNEIHKKCEDFVLGKLKRLPSELAEFADDFKALRKDRKHCLVEQQWAFSEKWEPVDWFAGNAWVRVMADLHQTIPNSRAVRIVDYKTGKVYPYHEEQLSLYAIAGFVMNPTVNTVIAELWYLDNGGRTTIEYERSEVGHIMKAWHRDSKAMLADTVFRPHPSNECRWCHFRRQNGGPCEH